MEIPVNGVALVFVTGQSKVSGASLGFQGEFPVEPKHTSQLLGNITSFQPCHMAAAVANRQSRCTHRLCDDLGLLVVRNVSEVPGTSDAPLWCNKAHSSGAVKNSRGKKVFRKYEEELSTTDP